MAGYRQNAPNVVNRAPDTQRPGAHSLTRSLFGPAELIPDMGAPTRWTPFGIFSPQIPGGRAMAAQRHDGLGGRLMDVPQADLLDSSRNPFPANGVADDPAMVQAIAKQIRLKPTTSAHPGLSLTSGEATPTMVFHAPPVFGLQTKPIYAVGL